MKLRVILVDDEPLARERLRRLLKKESEIEIVAESSGGMEAINAIREHKPELLFLDVQMPGMDGFELLKSLQMEAPPAVVFVTGYDVHAVRAFEERALDYLLKPTDQKRLSESLQRARGRIDSRQIPQPLLDLLVERRAIATLQQIPVRNGDKTLFVPVETIDWIESAGNYIVLHCGKENHICRETMSAMEAQLSSATFMRLSRSALVNLRRIQELQSVIPGEPEAVLRDKTRIPITRSIREVEERLKFV